MSSTRLLLPNSYIPAVIIVTVMALVLGYLVAQHAYPRPLPGIPYNKTATNRFFGDIPEISEFERKGGSFRTWFLAQAARHNSAITQVFLGPLSKPAIVVSDYREVNDILHRDAVDFKRGLKVDAFQGLLPHAFPAMETLDPRFKSSRDLARDLMTPSFLHHVNAPRIYEVTCHLLELWELKSQLAAGWPFDLAPDIIEFSFDAILSAAIGLESGSGDTKRRYEELTEHLDQNDSNLRVGGDTSPYINFRRAPESVKVAALRIEEDSLRLSFVMPWPKLYHLINNLRPSVRAARRTMREYIASQIDHTVRMLEAGREPQSALDFVIQREVRAATKEGRAPLLADPRILEPVYGYLIAGHDTSSGSLLWLIRRMVDHPSEQDRLRASLRTTYNAAWHDRRLPSVGELVKQHCAYLDAFIEETLRIDTPVPNIMVMTRCNTTILGQAVPANTRVFLNLTGPSLTRASVPIAEAQRGSYTRPAVARETWDELAPEEFWPGRWLKEDAARGKAVFDAGAGPTLSFSAGNRGCWGKRLGYLELRIALALMVWSFEFVEFAKLANWTDTIDSLVTAPRRCIVRVKGVSYE
ncbi:cytochrome P450 [Xylariaceae sp. FL0255]|nr:cytochrome P450 [Xylariaceae sp. FL0255]